MGLLILLLLFIFIIGSLLIFYLLLDYCQCCKVAFENEYGRSFYHGWAILSWLMLPVSVTAFFTLLSGTFDASLIFGWLPLFSLLIVYQIYMKKYGRREGIKVVTLQIIPICLFIAQVIFRVIKIMMIVNVFNRLFGGEKN